MTVSDNPPGHYVGQFVTDRSHTTDAPLHRNLTNLRCRPAARCLRTTSPVPSRCQIPTLRTQSFNHRQSHHLAKPQLMTNSAILPQPGHRPCLMTRTNGRSSLPLLSIRGLRSDHAARSDSRNSNRRLLRVGPPGCPRRLASHGPRVGTRWRLGKTVRGRCLTSKFKAAKSSRFCGPDGYPPRRDRKSVV